MTRFYFLLLTMIFTCGCGSSKSPNSIDPAFQPLYDQFVADASHAGIDVSGNQGITVQFAMLEQANTLGEVIGECSNVGYGNDTVSIDTKVWNDSDATVQFLLIYHELGHCLLSEGHSNDASAIMNPLINSPEAYYNSDLSNMLAQLFNQKGDYPTGVP